MFEENAMSLTPEKKTKSIRAKILLVVDHPILRLGIKTYIESCGDFMISAEANNANEALKAISRQRPDMCIVDLTIEGEAGGLELIKSIKNRFSGLPSILLTMHDEALFAKRAISSGAKGYILKKEIHESLLKAVKKILEGGLYLSEQISDQIIGALVHKSNATLDDPIESLGNKEFEVFKLIGQGFAAREIARIMALSKNTIESHKRHIKEKLQLGKARTLNRVAVKWTLDKKLG